MQYFEFETNIEEYRFKFDTSYTTTHVMSMIKMPDLSFPTVRTFEFLRFDLGSFVLCISRV